MANRKLVNDIEVGVTEAWTHADPQEREHVIDRLRWRFLEEQENHNDFSFGYLCIYKLKLLIKEKWQPRRRETGRENAGTDSCRGRAAPAGRLRPRQPNKF